MLGGGAGILSGDGKGVLFVCGEGLSLLEGEGLLLMGGGIFCLPNAGGYGGLDGAGVAVVGAAALVGDLVSRGLD